MAWYRGTTTICIVISLVGIMQAMNHQTFHRLFNNLLNDVDELAKSIVDYFSLAVVQLGSGRENGANKIIEVVEHYESMMSNSRPLRDLLENDFRNLINFIKNLESIRLVVKMMYAFFRQSAINVIDQLKRVYELN